MELLNSLVGVVIILPSNINSDDAPPSKLIAFIRPISFKNSSKLNKSYMFTVPLQERNFIFTNKAL